MMVHGIYLKSKPKGKWHLVSVAVSPEAANNEIGTTLKAAILQGNEQAQVGIQLFDSAVHIPESLSEIKNQKPQFN
jgi:mRNA-degrading endonuclease toxin of MazEF toxin-antitoxin module